MILVDTTVWIDFFGGRALPHVERLQGALETGEDLCICGIVLSEVLQGIRSDSDYNKAKEYFEDLLYIPMWRETYVRSAQLYRSLRKKRIIIRKPVDCLIAAVALRNDVEVCHIDRDFDALARVSVLRVRRLEQPKR